MLGKIELSLRVRVWHVQSQCFSVQKDLIARLGAGAQSGRASAAAKVLQHLQSPQVYIPKPFVPKKRQALGIRGGQQ